MSDRAKPSAPLLPDDQVSAASAAAPHKPSLSPASAAFESCAGAVAMVDPATDRISFCNPAFAQALGRSVAEVTGTSFSGICAPEDQESANRCLAEADRTGGAQHDLRLRRKDGSKQRLTMNLASVRNEQGHPIHRIASLLDAGHHRENIPPPPDPQADLDAILEATQESMILMEPDGTILAANQTAAARLKCTPASIQGRKVYDFLDAAVAASRRSRLEVVLRTGQSAFFHDQHGGRHFEHTLHPVRNTQGAVTRIAIFTRDVTDRTITAGVLRESDERFQRVVEAAPDAIFIQAEGKFAFANAAALKLFGADSPEQILARPVIELFIPQHRARVLARTRSVNEQRLPQSTITHTVIRADGTTREAEFSSVPFVHEGHNGALVFARDLSVRKQAEESVINSERKYRMLFEGSRDAIIIAAPDTYAFLSCNPAALTMFAAKSEADLLAMSPLTLSPERQPDGRLSSEFASEVGAVLAKRGAHSFEWKLRRLNGEEFFADVLLSRIFWDDRPVIMAAVRDVTERKQAAAALQRTESRFRNLVETSFDWVWEVDTQGRYTYASPRVRELLGYEPSELLGRTPFELMDEEEAARVRDAFLAKVRERRPFTALENVNRHKDGRTIILETSGTPVFASDGTWLGYVGMDRDITARRMAEQMLRLRGMALEAAANAIVITDATGRIEWANPAFTAISGWSLEEAAGRNSRELVRSDGHDADFYQNISDTIFAGRVWHGQVVSRRKDGALRTEETTITPLRDETGTISHFIEIKQDITESKAIEQRFLQAQRMEAIGTLAAGIAHDLNNILSPITMASGLLSDRLASDSDRELVTLVMSGARRGADVVKQLLSFSRRQEGERVLVQPRHLVREIMTIMRETFPRDINLRQRYAGDLWTVNADPTQLHQVLLNLCVNARDAMPDGGSLMIATANRTLGEGEMTNVPGAHAGSYVTLEVTDTGHGIPKEIRQRIFDPFFTTKPVGKGTGLGLSTALGIVQSHGGFLTVDSLPGRGTTFRVYLPANPDAQEATDDAAIPAPAPKPLDLTVLVVDDERDIRDSTRLVLEKAGYRVLLASNGADALAQFLSHRLDVRLVLTDLMMPVMNGMALVRALRAIDQQLQIIVATGLAETVNTNELASLGVKEILNKPHDSHSLLDALNRHLGER